MNEMQKQVADEQSRLWRESRELKIGSIAHLALLSSGAIIVSVNVLVPIFKLRGTPVRLEWLIVAWALLMLATVLTIPYRWTLGEWASSLARYLDYSSGRPTNGDADNLKRKMDASQSRLKLWWVITWICFVAGMVTLLVFVASNLL